MTKRKLKEKLEVMIDEKYGLNELDVNDEYRKIVEKIEFTPVTEKDTPIAMNNNLFFQFRKKLFIPLMIVFGIFLISMSSMVTYFVTKDNIYFKNETSQEYIDIANEYMSNSCDSYKKYPLQTNYISYHGVFNIYCGYNIVDNRKETKYYAQLYVTTSSLQDVKVFLSNDELNYELSSDGINKSIMVCLNDFDNFVNENSFVSIQGYYQSDLLLEAKYIF